MLDANKLQQAVDQAYTQFHSLNGGQNADYIPFLANVPGQLAAVAIVTCDGKVYSAGDSDYRFALESISKVCTLALALEDVGPQAVQDKIGADPTGLPFNLSYRLRVAWRQTAFATGKCWRHCRTTSPD
ncbi:glutaminase 1 [Escherichia coli]|uniref:glutaminase n=1 Tax=Escherichia coli TaxID=562 RepID=A0A376KYV7_ECOLX|nr:glutaminase 1 [Escherichia coli]